MNYAQVEKDDTFLMGRGHGELGYASGLYRATADLDLGALQAEFMASDTAFSRKSEVTLLMGDEEAYLYNRYEAYFQEWLLEQGHVERVPCKLLMLMAENVPKLGDREYVKVINSRVEDPFPEATAYYSPSSM